MNIETVINGEFWESRISNSDYPWIYILRSDNPDKRLNLSFHRQFFGHWFENRLN